MKTVKFASDIDTTKEFDYLGYELSYPTDEGVLFYIDFSFTPKITEQNTEANVSIYNIYLDALNNYSLLDIIKDSTVTCFEYSILRDLLE